LIGLDKLPIKAPHHSIIGDRGRGDSPNSSDKVVPYRTAHLDSAQSEKTHSLWARWMPKSRSDRGAVADSAPPLGPESWASPENGGFSI